MKMLTEEYVLKRLRSFMRKAVPVAKAMQRKAASRLKADATIVTEADLKISKLWAMEFADLRNDPTHFFVDEETIAEAVDVWARIGKSRYQWVLDPIDGTSNYAAGRNIWGIMAGVLKDGKPFAGLTYLSIDDAVLEVSPKKLRLLGGENFSESLPMRKSRPMDDPVFMTVGSILKYADLKRLPYRINALYCMAVMMGWAVLNRCHAVGIGTLGLWDIASVWAGGKHRKMAIYRLRDCKKVELTPEFFDERLKIKDFCVFSTKADCAKIRGFFSL